MTRKELIDIFIETRNTVKNIPTKPCSIYDEKLAKKLFAQTCKSDSKKSSPASVNVYKTDTLTVAQSMTLFPKNVVTILNFASPYNRGGGVVNGAVAQEEFLCRCSNLYNHLDKYYIRDEFYEYNKKNSLDFYNPRIVISPEVVVVKDKFYCSLPESLWYNVNVITSNAPIIRGKEYDPIELKKVLITRIRMILQAAAIFETNGLVLGAYGCGAFGNPPDIVAEAFRTVLYDEGYVYRFNTIAFAILVTNERDQINYNTFYNVFEGEK